MDKARKRLRVCLICVVLLAVMLGIFYYYHSQTDEQQANEGTLVMRESGLTDSVPWV